MGKMDEDCPCTRECPKRSPTCRTTCPEGKAWYEKKLQQYAEREKKREQLSAKCGYFKNRSVSVRREVKRRHGQ